jgi:hypothetical protein
MLTFDKALHAYAVNGKRLPSVTGIIAKVIPRTWSADEWAMHRGSMVHKAIAMYLDGTLDTDTIDERIKDRVEAGINACQIMAWKPGIIEGVMAHAVMGYAGTPDLIADNGDIVDWKGTVEATAEIQLGGYACLAESNKIKVRRLFAIQTTERGFRFNEYNLRRAKARWIAFHAVYGWMVENGL